MTSLHNLFYYFSNKIAKVCTSLICYRNSNNLCFLHVSLFFVWEYYLNMFNKLLIGFLDLKKHMFWHQYHRNRNIFGYSRKDNVFHSGHFEFSTFRKEKMERLRGSWQFCIQHCSEPNTTNCHAFIRMCTHKALFVTYPPHYVSFSNIQFSDKFIIAEKNRICRSFSTIMAVCFCRVFLL